MDETTPEPTFKLVGGWLCLDFANTINYDNEPNPDERFNSYADLVAWSRQAGALTPAEAQLLARAGEQHPAEAAGILTQAHALRDIIHCLFSAVSLGDPLPAADLDRLNIRLAEAMARSRLAPAGQGFAWAWSGEPEALERVLWPVLWSTAQLLTSDMLDRVGQCLGEGCGWLFLDTSRNRSRRWCDMKDCGNRAKARRHYHRRHVAP